MDLLLKNLVKHEILSQPWKAEWEKIVIKGMSADSRTMRAGDLFIAIPSVRQGDEVTVHHAYGALERGAAALIIPATILHHFEHVKVPVLAVEDVRSSFARLAACFYSAQPDVLAAVTGTNGKTSVCWFAKQLWNALGYHSAALGSLGLQITGQEKIYEYESTFLNTPDPLTLHSCLADVAGQGVTHLAMEATSHGLDQRRLDGVHLRAAAFTNISHEHLDYHGTLEAYYKAKRRLFAELLPQDGVAVLNADEHSFEDLQTLCRARGLRVLSYGREGADIKLCAVTSSDQGQHVELQIFGSHYAIDIPLAGEFQLLNVLGALGLVLAEPSDISSVMAALSGLQEVPGRLQRVGTTSTGAHIYIDYAHKPQALEVVLRALRAHCRGKLSVVFGCGGDRDSLKRPLMGAIAQTYADQVYITDDNPRTEDPASIRQAIFSGCPTGLIISDRKEAIQTAIAQASSQDIVLIAGKGHETHQIIGTVKYPFNDLKVAQEFLQNSLKGST